VRDRIHLEAWANEVLDSVSRGQIKEDDRIEFKSKWPTELHRAARQIAGMANAARGSEVLWMIGVDTRQTPPWIDPGDTEIANWWPSVRKYFAENNYPQCSVLQARINGVSRYALVFDTEKVPFFVTNPKKGEKAEPGRLPDVIESEIPWREGTAVRSIKRGELLGLLYRAGQMPAFEILSPGLTVQPGGGSSGSEWSLSLMLYTMAKGDTPAVLPLHRIAWSLELGQDEIKIPSGQVRYVVPVSNSGHQGAIVTESDLVIQIAGMVQVFAEVSPPEIACELSSARGRVQFYIGPDQTVVSLDFPVPEIQHMHW
jgi:hypothetical protein